MRSRLLEREDSGRRCPGMGSKRARNPSVAILTLDHAALAGLLGLFASSVVPAGATGGVAFLATLQDPALAVAPTLTVASLFAADAGISAFILLSVERAETSPRRSRLNRD